VLCSLARLLCSLDSQKKCSQKTVIFQRRMVKFFTTMEVLHLAVLLSVLFSVNGNTVNVSAGQNVNVRLNEEADLSCTTNVPVTFCTFISPGGEIFQINEKINYGRISYKGEDTTKDCGIKIQNVNDKDNGEWRCEITSIGENGVAKKGSNRIDLTVLKAPKSVSLDPQSLMVVDTTGSEQRIRCTAEGGHPAPTFTWTLGGEKAKLPIADTNTDENGVYMEEVVYEPNKADDGKILECVAESEAYTDEDLNAGINKAKTTLNVQYKPVPAKGVYEFYGLTVGQPFDIRISFRANPTPSDMRWKMHDGIEVPQGSEDEKGKYTSAIVSGPVEGEESLYTAQLTINNVDAEDAETLNTLMVTNEHGTSEIQFKLALGEKPPVGADLVSDDIAGENSNEDEAGAGPVIAVVVVILIVLVVVAIVVVARSQGLLCFAASDGIPDAEKGKFEALNKEDSTPEKETTKDIVKNEPAAAPVVEAPKGGEGDAEEKKSNGAHSPK